jgi:hypothetical protein
VTERGKVIRVKRDRATLSTTQGGRREVCIMVRGGGERDSGIG